MCGLLDIASDFLRRAALLFDRCRYRRRNLRNSADCGSNLLDRENRILSGNLHPGDLAADFISCLGRLRSERFHLLRNNRKASSRIPRASCLDGSV